jgi:acyl-homoserine-lactone acylase
MIKISVSFLFFFSFFITYNFAQINPDDITIIRDQWGVPHVYAKTDAQVAYGLAWASAEDDFETIQETLLPIRGGLGAVKGVEGAVLDFAAHLIEVNEIVDERYEAEISPKFKEILKAYAQGMNDFAEKYPKEILSKKMFPINGQDVIKGYTLALTLLSGLPGDLQKVVSGKMEALENRTPMGSNAFAVNSNKTKDGQTYLAINPHQPLEGPYSWYEAHLVSEEGMNVLGATLLGGMHVTVGANENLAWTHTVNHADFSEN